MPCAAEQGVAAFFEKVEKNMKKLLTLILTISIMASLAACGERQANNNSGKEEKNPPAQNVTDNVVSNDEDNDKSDKEEIKEEVKEEVKEEAKEETKKPEENKKPSEDKKPQADKTPSEDKKPEENKATAQEEKPQDATLGQTLLSAFKAQANSGKDVLSIAEALIANPAIKFSGGAMSIEEGLLSGFDNAEITGFKSGAMFAPMIGSIAFVGYVFELPEGADTSAFISNLKKNANLRWNICVAAEEMVTGSVGNKVFFVMCPTSLEG